MDDGRVGCYVSISVKNDRYRERTREEVCSSEEELECVSGFCIAIQFNRGECGDEVE